MSATKIEQPNAAAVAAIQGEIVSLKARADGEFLRFFEALRTADSRTAQLLAAKSLCEAVSPMLKRLDGLKQESVALAPTQDTARQLATLFDAVSVFVGSYLNAAMEGVLRNPE